MVEFDIMIAKLYLCVGDATLNGIYYINESQYIICWAERS